MSRKTHFGENDIRPKVLDEGKFKALEEDLTRLKAQKDNFIEVSCPACGQTDSHEAFEKYSFNFRTCNKCETVYMSPRATPEILNDFYAHSALYDYWNKYIFPSTQEVRRERIFKPRVERILSICEKYNISPGCMVEVGAGYGTFCEEMNRNGVFDKVIAVEPGSALAKSCRSVGVNTIEASIENVVEFEQAPDVIVSFEVIEHLFSPKEFILNCKRLMNSNSFIALTCPNFKGFDISALGSDSDSIDAEHINMFNPASLTLLFESCGFKVLECTTPGELDVDILHNKIMKQEYDVSDQPFLKTVLVDRYLELGGQFQSFLKDNQLSSNMWIVAQRLD